MRHRDFGLEEREAAPPIAHLIPPDHLGGRAGVLADFFAQKKPVGARFG
jgi:hypothetical protein